MPGRGRDNWPGTARLEFAERRTVHFGIVQFCSSRGRMAAGYGTHREDVVSELWPHDPWALAISQNLTRHGYDVFFDFNYAKRGATLRANF
jgi:hypothetical protein